MNNGDADSSDVKFAIKSYDGERDVRLVFHCPGCHFIHSIRVSGESPVWQFNGDVDHPTVHPSIRVQWYHGDDDRCCHSFLEDGRLRFLDDCTHDLAGQTVDVPLLDTPMIRIP